jgi:uncharacterized SAM-binding protein YcdF (DUF218 family)/lysophospholipase L1-like esterase
MTYRMPTRRLTFRQGVLVGVAVVLLAQYLIDRTPVADWLVSPLLLRDTQEPADVIVVAGAGLVGPCEPNLSAVRRVLKAAALWSEQRAPFILFTGGSPKALSCAVSDVMADFAVRVGIPRDRILTEATSVNTRENAFYAVPVLESLGARRVTLVTDRLHMLRASRSFAAVGYTVGRASVPVYATHRGNVDMLAGSFREAVAIAYYWIRGWLGAGAAALNVSPTTDVDEATDLAAKRDGPVVILGASYAEGWRLEAVAGAPVINKGVEGQQSFELAERFDRDVLAHKPRAVVIWGFINDVFRTPRADIQPAMARARSSITGMIARGQEAGLEVILATEVPITTPAGWTNTATALVGRLLRRSSYQEYVNGQIRETNAWIRQTAREKGLILLDFERVLASPDGDRRRVFAQPDGSHLTEAAYAALTRHSVPVLERHFGGVQ